MRRSRAIRRDRRFPNQLDDHLVHLHKNLYLNPSDPQYYEKVIRFLDAHSPEAHFQLGQKYEKRGNYEKALFHYHEVLKTYPSPYYSDANRAIRALNKKEEERLALMETAATVEPRKEMLPSLLKMLLIVLVVLNVLLIALFFGSKPLYKVISTIKPWGVSKDVTYETVDVPYVMYFSEETDNDHIESALYNKAVEIGSSIPDSHVMIYGVITSDRSIAEKTLLLSSDEVKAKAFVVAEYIRSMDQSVKIRFLNAEYDKHQTLSAFGANFVRTALEAYKNDHGSAPASIAALLQDYPGNYMSYIPLEASSGSNEVKPEYDGQGGWVYDPASTSLERMFYANVPGSQEIPFEPLRIEIDKEQHRLRLISGSRIALESKVGLGAEGRTPEGSYPVVERVLNPHGMHPDVYGDAGLGLGAIAIHGTNDESSIGGDKSLGCIRMSNGDIRKLFEFVPKGTVVTIAAMEESVSAADGQLAGGSSGTTTKLGSGDLESLLPGSMPRIDESPEQRIFHWLG